ncbi:MAG: hypothetical protein RSE94_02105 [Pseudomonas sp.]
MKDEFVMVRRNVLVDACSFDDGTRLSAQHAIEALLAQPAEQHQGEPVAWMYTRSEVEWPAFYDKRKDAAGWKETPLFTHADPGEVERLQRELSVTNKLYAEACQASYDFGSLRAQLAERDALIEEAYSDGWNDGLGSMEQRYQNTPRTLTEGWGRFKADNALSASAEPSAPIIHPINMKVMMQAYEQVDHKALLHGTSNWCASMATALRGVLQWQPSAPVERDERAEFEHWECYAPEGPQVDPMWMSRCTIDRNAYGIASVQKDWEAWQARECKS